MRLSEFTTLLKLSAIRKQSVENYFKFQRYQASLIHKDLQKYGLQFAKRVLDIGSGIGGYVYEFSEKHEKTNFYSLDLNPLPFAQEKYKDKKIFTVRGDITHPPFKDNSFDFIFASSVIEHIEEQARLTKSIANIATKKIFTVRGDITHPPFKDNSFDFIFASSVIEHIEEQARLTKSIANIATENSLIYISFPPFYSLMGGHSISPLHYLPGNLPFYIYKNFYRQTQSSFKNYGLVKTTLRSAENIIKNNFDIIDIKPRFFTSIKPLIKIPILREIIAPHIEFFLRPKK